MDLAAEMLAREAKSHAVPSLEVTSICPAFRRRLSYVPGLRSRASMHNADRFLNRLWDYPRFIGLRAAQFDLFHVVDHSYSQLIHALPAERTGVFCHDLDTFRCLLEPAREPRPRWFRAMARHILRGIQKAAIVFYSTDEITRQIEQHELLDPARLVKAPYGIASEFSHLSREMEPAATVLKDRIGKSPCLLHVGSCIARKRIDVLVEVFAAIRKVHPELLLVKVGGEFTQSQHEQIHRAGVESAIVHLRGLSREQLASLYRQAAVVLQPSEAEGFGLPVLEALACGARVVASDIPVLREVGGRCVVFCPIGDVGGWVTAVLQLLGRPDTGSERDVRLRWASRFSWAAHARTVFGAYARILEKGSLSKGEPS